MGSMYDTAREIGRALRLANLMPKVWEALNRFGLDMDASIEDVIAVANEHHLTVLMQAENTLSETSAGELSDIHYNFIYGLATNIYKGRFDPPLPMREGLVLALNTALDELEFRKKQEDEQWHLDTLVDLFQIGRLAVVGKTPYRFARATDIVLNCDREMMAYVENRVMIKDNHYVVVFCVIDGSGPWERGFYYAYFTDDRCLIGRSVEIQRE